MKRLGIALVLAFGLATSALGQDEGSPTGPQDHNFKPVGVETLLDRLAASEPDVGARLEAEILNRFHDSGRPTINLLLGWAVEAMQSEDYTVALDLIDQVTLLAPNFAEGWNKRATIHFLSDEYGKSLSDIHKALALQPRHFGALSGLGLILKEIGEEEQAIAAFTKALAINPHMKNAKDALDGLQTKAAGNAI